MINNEYQLYKGGCTVAWVKYGFTSALQHNHPGLHSPKKHLPQRLSDRTENILLHVPMESHVYSHLIEKWRDVSDLESNPVHTSQEAERNKDISDLKFPDYKSNAQGKSRIHAFPHPHNSSGNKWHKLALVSQGTWMSNTADLYD